MSTFPDFVDPVTINGKTFERADIPEAVASVSRLLCAASDKPAECKIPSARFLLAAEQTGCVRLQSNIRKYCNMLTK